MLRKTVLVTGGTGKTGFPVAQVLRDRGWIPLIASRSGQAREGLKAVTFNWNDPATYSNPWQIESNIFGVYLVLPDLQPLSTTKSFIDLAISKGVKRFVLLSAICSEKGDNSTHGPVHEYIEKTGIDFGVVRPTWFHENFGASGVFLEDIRDSSTLFSAFGDGKIPFISCHDIAQGVFDMFAADVSPNTDRLVLGPKLYSMDEATSLLSDVIGRKIVHKKLTLEEEKARLIAKGDPEDIVDLLLVIEDGVSKGSDSEPFGDPKAISGKTELRHYFEANKHLWS